MTKEDLISKFVVDAKIPSLSDLAMEILRTLDSENVRSDRVVELVSKDPAITLALLRQANSARYGMTSQVVLPAAAVNMLGFSQVRSVVLAASMSGMFKEDHGLGERFWKSSETTGDISFQLAKLAKADYSSAWLAGFMVRIGELLIGRSDKDLLANIEKLPIAPGERWVREFDLIGVYEGEIVASIASSWCIPDEVVTALRLCGNPLDSNWPFSKVAAIVNLASVISDALQAGLNDEDAIVDLLDPVLLEGVRIEPLFVRSVIGNYANAKQGK